ncbi:hypothetical protein H8957_017427, partial [Semnopithecus entellus]
RPHSSRPSRVRSPNTRRPKSEPRRQRPTKPDNPYPGNTRRPLGSPARRPAEKTPGSGSREVVSSPTLGPRRTQLRPARVGLAGRLSRDTVQRPRASWTRGQSRAEGGGRLLAAMFAAPARAAGTAPRGRCPARPGPQGGEARGARAHPSGQQAAAAEGAGAARAGLLRRHRGLQLQWRRRPPGASPLPRLQALGPAAPSSSWPDSRDRGAHPPPPPPRPPGPRRTPRVWLQGPRRCSPRSREGAWEREERLRGRILPQKVAPSLLDFYFLVVALKRENLGFKEPGPASFGRLFSTFGCYVRASAPKEDFPGEKCVLYLVDSHVQVKSLV